jgi:hypothetical protein
MSNDWNAHRIHSGSRSTRSLRVFGLQCEPFSISPEELLEDTRIATILDLINEARLNGPKRGRESLKRAESLLRDVVKNPFVQIHQDLVELISLEITAVTCINSYNPNVWHSALERAQTSLRKISENRRLAAAIPRLSIFVRDEYGMFADNVRLALIKTLLDRIDPWIANEQENRFVAFLLGAKSGLLRWRGRILRSNAQQATFLEAERCANRSLAKTRSLSAVMQLFLIKYAQARILPLSELPKYDEEITQAISIISSSELDEFSAAIKYRPRFFRDIYMFDQGIECFWRGVEYGYLNELRNAFVLGECYASRYSYISPDAMALEKGSQFLGHAIAAGYDHERNFMSWITCHSLLNPDWFQAEVLPKFNSFAELLKLVKVLHDDTAKYFGMSVRHVIMGV